MKKDNFTTVDSIKLYLFIHNNNPIPLGPCLYIMNNFKFYRIGYDELELENLRTRG